jgi:hypothetical protein
MLLADLRSQFVNSSVKNVSEIILRQIPRKIGEGQGREIGPWKDTPNKQTALLRDAILEAATTAGRKLICFYLSLAASEAILANGDSR